MNKMKNDPNASCCIQNTSRSHPTLIIMHSTVFLEHITYFERTHSVNLKQFTIAIAKS